MAVEKDTLSAAQKHLTFLFIMCVVSFPTSVLTGSHSLRFLVTCIKEETPLPTFSVVYMLDDIIVGYYDSETKSYIPKGNTTNEDEEVDLISYSIKKYLEPFILGRLAGRFENKTKGFVVHQMMSMCEVSDNDISGQLVTKMAFEGSTTDEIRFIDNTLTHEGIEKLTTTFLDVSKWLHATVHYPRCTTGLRMYLKKRGSQGKRRVKPRVRLIQKTLDSGGFVVSCLATGFYPRHINLTLLRDEQPVSDHEVTGGDLLPNGDGTYQMRKSLEIRAEEREKHKYTCSAKHLSLDNKLDVDLEFDHGAPFKSVIPSVVAVLMLMLVFGVAAVIWRRWFKDSPSSGYSTPSNSEDNMETK